jgi:hypothetical protein
LKPGTQEHGEEILKRQYRYFFPCPPKFTEICREDFSIFMGWLMREVPLERTTHFSRITEREVLKMDKDFICKIMKLDWRDRPTAKELLEDEWWDYDGGDYAVTRGGMSAYQNGTLSSTRTLPAQTAELKELRLQA